MRIGKGTFARLAIAMAAIAALIATGDVAIAKNSNPRVVPVNAHPHGLSYGEWAAEWWK